MATMNPIDNNPGIRPQRSEIEQGSGRSRVGDGGDSQRAQPAGETARAESGESVSLTRAAADLLQLEDTLQNLPEVDRARVEAIRSAIADGSYEVDASRIVDSLLQSEAELR